MKFVLEMKIDDKTTMGQLLESIQTFKDQLARVIPSNTSASTLLDKRPDQPYVVFAEAAPDGITMETIDGNVSARTVFMRAEFDGRRLATGKALASTDEARMQMFEMLARLSEALP